MANKTINTKKCFKISIIAYAILIIVGVIMTVVSRVVQSALVHPSVMRNLVHTPSSTPTSQQVRFV